ncbi:hypothetical protein AVT42_gp52 [Polaribacter phage P12002S]|uniref:Uncharacterized protein n=1 Tax=Polaribacter phage P12002S TaxID=1647387 RepID=A0A0F7IKM3_9CAUD|nr:hypothetical protein AVT42_gp52 [Polaribacter phage P12002S]AKG94308.1 hypothetical protein P12002S_0052 [Polaribacter phage P12002S]
MKVDKLTIASELIIKSTEMKGKRPTQLNFEELIDVVESLVKNLALSDVSQRSEPLGCNVKNCYRKGNKHKDGYIYCDRHKPKA